MPTPRPRARCITPKGRKPIVTMYSPKEYQEWFKEAAEQLLGVELDGQLPVWPTEALMVDLRVEVAKPKTTKLVAPKPDVDNFAKGILDAITKDGRIWADDTQIVRLTVTKAWTTGTPGYHVSIKDL